MKVIKINVSLVALLFSVIAFAQEEAKLEANDVKSLNKSIDAFNRQVEKLQRSIEENENKEELSTMTIGVAVGYNHLFQTIYDYSLTTDTEHRLKVEELNSGSVVVSSALIFRFNNFDKKKNSNKLYLRDSEESDKSPDIFQKFSAILSLNLLDINSSNGIDFNKSIDGGIGLGYQIEANLNIALLYELKRVRQMRSYVVEQYENESIPQGTEVYNSLDSDDNNLFYNKSVTGISLKLIFNFSSL